VSAVATAINNAFSSGQPPFQVVRYDLPRPDTFTLQTRQRVGIGYRECLIVGGQVRENETRILFKVFEFEHLPDLNLLGGLLKLTGNIKITSEDAKFAKEKAEKFKTRIEEGVQIVKEKIRKGL